jgi:predicted dehydrogenase
MSERFRIAMIGCGRIASRHVRACLASDDLELAALVDPVVARAEELAREFKIAPIISPSLSEAAGSVDGAVIAAPNHLHRELALACLEAKLHVLVEKPLATSVADGQMICEAAERAGTVVAVGYVTRFRKNVQLFRELLERGYFGAIRRFAYQFGTRGGWAPLSAYNLDRQASGGGVLVVTGTHFLDRMLYWFGYPDEAWLEDDAVAGPEANAVVRCSYRRGGREMHGCARFSKTVRLPAGFVMETDEGVVVFPDSPDAQILFRSHAYPGIEVTVNRDAGKARREPDGSEDSFQLQLEDFARACRGGGAPMVSGEDGLESLRLLEQLYARRERLPDAWNDPVELGSAV